MSVGLSVTSVASVTSVHAVALGLQVLSTLTEIMRDNFRTSKVKQALLPAIGEVLYLIASQEEVKGQVIDQWAVPAMTYTMLTRCLREGVRGCQCCSALSLLYIDMHGGSGWLCGNAQSY